MSMANHPQRIDVEPEAPPAAPAWRLTDALDAKLHELKGRGLEVQWIECCGADLTNLVIEGGDAAIRLDPDPSVDQAWYGDVEIRHSARALTWVFLTGEAEAGEVSAHVIGPPDTQSD
jgi:hypothetical protein